MHRSPLAARLTSQPVLISPAGMDGLLAIAPHQPAGGMMSRLFGLTGRKAPPEAARPAARVPDALAGRAVEHREGYILADGIAVIRVDGVLWDEGYCYDDGWWSFSLYGYDDLRRALAAADADPAVRGIWLRINSPGGLVTGMTETCAAVAAVGKPLTAFVAGDGCSAAYALAGSAPRIVCAPAATVGSIGVVWVHLDTSKADERWGLTYTPIQFGAAKTDGAPFKPLSDAARAHAQGQIDTLGRRFAEHVADRRGLSVDAVIATEARVEMDEAALALGLVDEVAPEAAAFAAFAQSLSAGAPAAPTASPASAKHAATQEETMGLKQQIAAALKRRKAGKAAADDVLNQIAALVAQAEDTDDETSAEAGEGDEDEEKASTDEDETSAADGTGEADPAEDDEDEPAARKASAGPKAGTAAYVLAVMDLPEARGREALARELAASALPLARVKKALACAPKKSAFAPQNPEVSAGGGKSAADADARLLAAGEARAKRRA